MRTKIDELILNVELCNYDVLILIETWLNSDFLDSELNFTDFNLYRKDRSVDTSDKSRGGGVLIAVRKYLSSKLVVPSSKIIEDLYVKINFGHKKVLIGGVYIPPRSSVEMYYTHIDNVFEISNIYPEYEMSVFGDYNIPDCIWVLNNEELVPICEESSFGTVISDNFSAIGMNQVCHLPNNHNVFLDLVFSQSCLVTVNYAYDLLLPVNYHHNAFTVYFQVEQSKDFLSFDNAYFDFKSVNFSEFNNYITSIQWDCLYSMSDINQALQYFYEIIYDAIYKFVPIKRFRSSNFPVWFSSQLKTLVIEKKIAHQNYKDTNSEEFLIQFRNLRRQCKELSKICHNNYIRRMEHNIQTNPGMFWRHMSNLRKSSSFPNSMFLDNEVASEGSECVNLFAKFFSSVYSNSCAFERPNITFTNSVDISSIDINLESVFNGIQQLKPKYSYGPDGIPPILLKNCVCAFARPVHFLFSLSLVSECFPDFWKHSFIAPIFKQGNKENIKNYRGVCMQSALPKLLDELVASELSWKCKNVIIPQQHGFCTGKSTVTNLLVYEQALLNALKNGHQVDSVYTDFSKAFDKVNHDLLLLKLEGIGFGKKVLTWLGSFLKNRSQSVRINNFISNIFHVPSGVPQGSHCGPLLFNLFINDIGLVIKNVEFLLFADDLKLFSVITSILDSQILQRDLDHLYNWSVKNCLPLNSEKCQFISFFKSKHMLNYAYSVDGVNLKRLGEIKDLGIILDERLTFKSNLRMITSRGNKMLGFVMRNSKNFSTEIMKVLYCAHVRSSLEYASIVWSPIYNCDKNIIENIQVRFTRYIAFKMGIYNNFNYKNILSILNMQSLKVRRISSDLIFLYKLLNNIINCSYLLSLIRLNVPSHNIRRPQLFDVTTHTTNYASNMPITRAVRVFNNNSQLDPFAMSLSQFKRCLRQVVETE